MSSVRTETQAALEIATRVARPIVRALCIWQAARQLYGVEAVELPAASDEVVKAADKYETYIFKK